MTTRHKKPINLRLFAYNNPSKYWNGISRKFVRSKLRTSLRLILNIGRLPFGLSETKLHKRNVSILRNPTLGNIFLRLHFLEILGTGIVRIREVIKAVIKTFI
ncbi:MAG: hypothetical protein IJG67_00175 [Oscillospiraceae bacterium]|nr:hypothetical protein [Oscillospiraceae bacterium]